MPFTVKGSKVSVEFTVKVFVKHNGWDKMGEGQVTILPITIVNSEVAQELKQEVIKPPPGWNPHTFEVREYGQAHHDHTRDAYHEKFVLTTAIPPQEHQEEESKE